MPSTGTSNTTSFARDTLTATALILDALAGSGSERRSLLTQAQTLLYAAHKNACQAQLLLAGLGAGMNLVSIGVNLSTSKESTLGI